MRWIVFLLLLSGAADAREDVAAAREHYKNGTKLFDIGKYLEAAREYEAAYQFKEDPSLLFNIGQSYRLAGEKDAALRAYKSFLRRSPEAGNRAAVQSRIDELQKAIDQEQKAKEGPPDGTARPMTMQDPVVSPPAPRAPEKVPVYKKWWLWTIVGGVVVAGAAVGLGVGLGTAPKSFEPTVKDIGPAALVSW
jgi:tetratricopeptide (TPR) repeat protein